MLTYMTTILFFMIHGIIVMQEGFSPVIFFFLACQGGAGKVFGKSVLFDNELNRRNLIRFLYFRNRIKIR